MRIWPYKILARDDDEIKQDLLKIMGHFRANGDNFDMVVFVPNAGRYLRNLFIDMFGKAFDINLVTVRRASTISNHSRIKTFVFQRRRLANIMRHVEVLLRLLKCKTGLPHKRSVQPSIDFDVAGKRILVIDDSADTGTTFRIVKSALQKKGAQSVVTACISNHLIPDKVNVDYCVYRYALLRTKNSRDYYAT
ncbi:MAG: phosphoribosyltransferase family protein [Planctomycetota bacterium]